MTKPIHFWFAVAVLALLACPTHAASLTLGSRVKVSTNVVDFNISVFPGKAGYEGDDESPVASGTFGDGTVVDYRFFSSPNNAIFSYADGGAGLVGMASCPPSNINGEGESWSDLWTTNDPGVGYNTTPNFPTTVNTFARSANISGSIDISGLESGTVYIPHGTFINDWTLSLTMTGPGQPILSASDTQGGNGPSTNFGWITDFSFTDAALYDTISYTYTNGDTDGSRARFMGVILDGTAVALSPPVVINGSASNIGPSFATVAGEVTDPGGPAPSVTIYYGDHDGDTAPGSWDASLDLGNPTGVFSSALTGLSPATTYYFRAFASNGAGSDWADTTKSFVTASAPDPPTIVNSPVSDLDLTSATVGGEVTATGGELPLITIYWGENDEVTNSNLWDNATVLGTQSGSFTHDLLSLTHNTTYYYRCFASNSGGSAWAPTTSSFTTNAFGSPTVGNLSATGVTGISAIVGGEVTATGGDPPNVTIYVGESDGDTTPGSWDDSISLGAQASTFLHALTGLSPLTTYHVRAFVQNAAGASWSPSSETFTTSDVSELILNEFLAANDGTYANYPNPGQVAGRLDDWIEILNTGAGSLSLAGWHLTDDPGELDKWTFPAGTSLDSGFFLIVYASGDDLPDANGNLHTSFRLNGDGEYLALVRPDLSVASEFGPNGTDYPNQSADISFGIHPASAAAVFFAVPTPGTPNDPGGTARVADTKFSVDRGIFSTPIEVAITTTTVGATIYYTTGGEDPITAGGDPTPNALVYSTPINISQTTVLRAAAIRSEYDPTNIDTQTYVFLPSVATQPNNPPGVPTTWGGASADYEVDPEVTGSTIPGYSLEEALLSIPSISLSTAPGELFGSSNGIYNNSGRKGDAWERQASLEFIDPDGGDQFQVDCGVAVHGASSRGHGFTKKHSLRLLFQSQFGASKLNFPLFENGPTNKFDILILRACSTDSWPAQEGNSNFGIQRWHTEDASYQRDQWMRDTQVDLGHDSARGRYVHLYLNGLYWGVYNLTERPNNSFNSSHFGGEDDDWDVIHDRGELQSGDTVAWNEMFALADAGLASDAAYMEIQGRNPDGTPNPALPVHLDLDHFIDYMLFHIYAGAEDWPCHNYWAARRRGPDSEGFRFYVWDQEISNNSLIRERTWCSIHFEFLESDVPFLTSRSDLRKSPAKLYYQLRQNAQFRLQFADRVHELLFNNGLLSSTQSHARWMRRATEIDQAIVGESARWGDSRLTIPHKRETEWIPHQEWLRRVYWRRNHSLAVQRFRNVDLYPSIGAPTFCVDGVGQHGGRVSVGAQVSIVNSSGSPAIYFTTDGSDPRLPNGSISPAATLYTNPLLVDEGQRIQARSFVSDDWSALTSALFTVDIPLRVTEIMYNPAESEFTEYIELMNISGSAIAIAGIRFDGSTEGIEFAFDSSEPMLGAGERIVVVRSQSAFAAKYNPVGMRLAIGEYDGSGTKLSNDGEMITLRDSLGGLIQQFTYNDVSPWTELPDGAGPSLVLIAPGRDPDPGDPANWRPSALFGGRPGSSDAVAFSGDPNADLDGNGVPDLVDHGLAEGGAPAISIVGDQVRFEFIRDLRADDVVADLQVSLDLLSWTDGASIFTEQNSQYLGTGGMQMRFEAPLSAPPAPRYFVRVRFQAVE